MTDYGDPSLFYVNSEIGIFDLEDAIIEYLPRSAANLMAIKSLSRSWRWGALTAFHWEGGIFCKCGKHMLLNPTKLQKPNAEKDAWCCDGWCGAFCTCNIPKCLKNDDELQEQIGGYPAFEFLAIDFGVCHGWVLEHRAIDCLRKRQPNIDNVYFDSWPQDDVVAIRFITSSEPNSDEEINNKLLERFGPRNLRLFVAGNAPVSPKSLQKCGKLTWLDLWNAREIVDGETVNAAAKLPQLNQLSLNNCQKIPKEIFKLLRDNASIETLGLSVIASDEIVEDVSQMRSLTSLDVSFSFKNLSCNAIASLVAHKTPLKSFNMSWCEGIKHDADHRVTHIASMRCLGLGWLQVDDSALQEIATMLPTLENLRLGGEDVTSTGIATLGKLTSLQVLSLDEMKDGVPPSVFSAALENLANLRVLEVANARQLGVEHLRFFEKKKLSRTLEVLDLRTCRSVGDEVLALIGSSLPNLKTLKLSECKNMTTEGFAHLSSLKHVELLDLCYTNTEDEALRHVAGGMTSLRWLKLRDCEKITDNGLRFLHGLPALEFIDLSRCGRITLEEVVLCISASNQLKFLNLTGTRCSDSASVRAIEERFPDAVVVLLEKE